MCINNQKWLYIKYRGYFTRISRNLSEDLATVITNLLSAIPWIGQEFVQWTNYGIDFNVNSFNDLCIFNFSILPIVGILGKGIRNRNLKTDLEKEKLLSIPYSFLSVLIGIIDGDGYIRVTKTMKGYIEINLTIP